MNIFKILWALSPPGAIANIIRRSIEAEQIQDGAVYGVVLGSHPTAIEGDTNPHPWERYEDPRNPIAYRRIIRPARRRQ